MNLYLRLILVLLRARFGARIDPLGTVRTPFRAWPHDLDVNAHVNNGRYATLMDLGRVDLMARSGLMPIIRTSRMHPVVTAQHIVYRRSIAPFEAFELRSRVIGWDERFVYMEQVFERAGRFVARGVIQALFLGPAGRVPSAELMTMFGVTTNVPVPSGVAALFPAPERTAPERTAPELQAPGRVDGP